MDSNNNAHRQHISRHPPTPICDPTLHNHRHSRRSEKRDNGIVSAALMHACQSHPSYIFTCSEAAATTRYTRTGLPIYLQVSTCCPPTRSTNLISPSVIRQKPTVDKSDVAIRIPSRPGSEVQHRAGHLLFVTHPLRWDQSPRHHAAGVLPCFGDGGCHVGWEP
jgi:hypothetical protein